MKKNLLKASLIISVLFISAHLSAQFGGGGGTPGGSGTGGFPTTGGGPEVPFDGGLSILLLASGVGYATKRMRKSNING